MRCTDLINRLHPLPPDFVPDDLTAPRIPFDALPDDPKRLLSRPAAQAAEKLFQAAAKDCMALYGISGYRPYARQRELFEAHMAAHPELALSPPAPLAPMPSGGNSAAKDAGTAAAGRSAPVILAVAPPGASEHQSGLALDVSCPAAGLELTEDFARTPEGAWLSRNAPLYGFVIRYPRGKETVTGCPWEPWHIRYVTRPLALYLDMTGLTLDEYIPTEKLFI